MTEHDERFDRAVRVLREPVRIRADLERAGTPIAKSLSGALPISRILKL